MVTLGARLCRLAPLSVLHNKLFKSVEKVRGYCIFKIRLNDKELPFRLPAKAERVYRALWGDKQAWEHTRYGEGWRAQAERIAWRICKTWLEAQITLINLEQAKLEEVFLPYLVMPNDKTLFETMEHNQFLLPDGS
jgi:hypothetical protein